MAGLLTRITVTPLLWACGLQLVAIAVLGGLLYVQDARVDVALAASESAAAWAKTTSTERDAWKRVAETAGAANAKWAQAYATVKGLLDAAQRENDRLADEGRAAVRAAQAEAAAADRRLADWQRRYAEQVRAPDCSAALSVVQLRCPALEGY